MKWKYYLPGLQYGMVISNFLIFWKSLFLAFRTPFFSAFLTSVAIYVYKKISPPMVW